MNARSTFTTLVSVLALLVLLVTLGATSALAEPDRVKLANTDPAMYAPTHNELYHQVVGIHGTWVLWMTDRLRVSASLRGKDWTVAQAQLYLDETHECASALNLEVLTTSLVINNSPFTDDWLTVLVVGKLLDTCEAYFVPSGPVMIED